MSFVDPFGRDCLSSCMAGCPTSPSGEQWHGNTGSSHVKDGFCVERCKVTCRGSCPAGKDKCRNPGGSVQWLNTFANSGPTMALGVTVSGVDSKCCSEVGVVQFVKWRFGLGGWTDWDFDDGRVLPGSEASPSPPFICLRTNSTRLKPFDNSCLTTRLAQRCTVSSSFKLT